ncbi:MAG: amino acid ABC transporter substrate-binding protein, partial [Burkholderiales bacterium]
MRRTLLVFALSCAFAAPAAAQTGTLEKIRGAGAITLGYIEDAAPFSFADAKREPQGYSVDLCREIARG